MDDLASYAMNMSPQQRAMLMVQTMRGQPLQQANEQAHSMDLPAIAAMMSNNPELAQAAQMGSKQAQARYKPVQMGNQGFAIPSSGEFVSSPMFEREHDAQRQMRLQVSEGQRQDRLRTTMETLRSREAVAAEGRASREAMLAQTLAVRQAIAAAAGGSGAADNAAAKSEKDIAAGVGKLTAFADKKQVGRLTSNARKLAEQFAEADSSGKEVPGFGMGEQIAARIPLGDNMLSTKSVENMAALQGIYNAFMRSDAGLSQTMSEAQRQALETFNSPTKSYRTRVTAFRDHVLPLIELARTQALGSAPPEVRERYKEWQGQVGGDAGWMEPLPMGRRATDKAPAAAPQGGDLVDFYLQKAKK